MQPKKRCMYVCMYVYIYVGGGGGAHTHTHHKIKNKYNICPVQSNKEAALNTQPVCFMYVNAKSHCLILRSLHA